MNRKQMNQHIKNKTRFKTPTGYIVVPRKLTEMYGRDCVDCTVTPPKSKAYNQDIRLSLFDDFELIEK